MRVFMVFLALAACRPDPGAPDYPEPEPWVVGDDDPDFYDDAYEDGETRLGIGVFYEGEATETVSINGSDTFYYVYSDTYTDTSTDDRWEGYVANLITNNGVGWWGGGIHWTEPGDLSAWTHLHLAARSTVLADWTVGMTGGTEVRVPVADYGFSADGDWHEVEIPLSDLAEGGVDLTAVTVALLLIGEAGTQGDEITLDGVYFRGSE